MNRFKTFFTQLRSRFVAQPTDGSDDSLSALKKQRSRQDQFELVVLILLVLTLFFMWTKAPTTLAHIDQLSNDLSEQLQLIEVEKKNNQFLEELDDAELNQNLRKVYSALPIADEQSEAVVSMLESMARQNQMVIESISIRELPVSQFYYDDLVDVVQPYEYNFSIEHSSLNNITSFLNSLRHSLRIMDIMSIDIEEGRDSFKASLSVYAYHIL